MSNDIRDVFKRFRDALNETEEKQNGVPYTQQDEILQTSMQSATEAFGADFSSIKTPMFYYRQDGDITLSGIIPSLNDANNKNSNIQNSGNSSFVPVNMYPNYYSGIVPGIQQMQSIPQSEGIRTVEPNNNQQPQ